MTIRRFKIHNSYSNSSMDGGSMGPSPMGPPIDPMMGPPPMGPPMDPMMGPLPMGPPPMGPPPMGPPMNPMMGPQQMGPPMDPMMGPPPMDPPMSPPSVDNKKNVKMDVGLQNMYAENNYSHDLKFIQSSYNKLGDVVNGYCRNYKIDPKKFNKDLELIKKTYDKLHESLNLYCKYDN